MSFHAFQYSLRGEVKIYPTQDESDSEQQSYNKDLEKLSLKQIEQLLRLYHAHPCLWDKRDVNYGNHKARNAALNTIAQVMGGGWRQIAYKIQLIRANYRREKSRIKQRYNKGLGIVTSIKWFPLAYSFLKDTHCSDEKDLLEAIDNALGDGIVEFNLDTETEDGEREDDRIKMELEEGGESVLNTVCSVNINNPVITPEIDLSSANEAILVDSPVIKAEIDTSTTDEAILGDNTICAANIHNPVIKTEIDTTTTDEAILGDNTICAANIHNPVIKTEIDNCFAREAYLVDSFEWSSQESIEFVSQLRSYPLLWQLPINEAECETEQQVEYEKALEAFSHAMQLPKPFLKGRLKDFLSFYQQEMEKTKQDHDYKPSFVWWPLVREYLYTQSEANRSQVDESSQSNESMSLEQTKDNEDTTSMSSLKIQENWTLRHCVKFLRLFGAHRCLWDHKDPSYRYRKLRHAAYVDIAAAMGHDLDADYVAIRINMFRIAYRKDLTRWIEDLKNNREPQFKHRWFPLADRFLRKCAGERCIKKLGYEPPKFDYQDIYTSLRSISPTFVEDLNVDCTE